MNGQTCSWAQVNAGVAQGFNTRSIIILELHK